MKSFRSLFCLFSLCISFPFSTFAANEKIGDFSLIDQQGKFHQLSRYANRKAVVLFIQSNDCPASLNTASSLKETRTKFENQAVDFLMLNASAGESRASIATLADELALDFPILKDETQLVAESLAVQRSGEVFILDPGSREILYRGPAQNQLQNALTTILAGGTLTNSEAKIPTSRGCEIAFNSRTQHQNSVPSYVKDIVPILENRCVKCHQEGGIAPWAMSSHQMVRGWGPMMRETVMTGRMPPGQIDNLDVDKFKAVNHITAEEQSTLVHWINAGSPIDGTNDPLTSLTIDGSEWELGEPDMVVDIPVQEVPATGVIDYRYIPVDVDLPEDKWISAYEFSVGDKTVLHHIIAFLRDESGQQTLMGGYGPGKPGTFFPDDAGFLLTPDSGFVMQIHYTTTGKATTDHTKLALHFSDKPPTMVLRNDAVVNPRFVIPANTQDHNMTATTTIPQDAYLYSFSPHMHFRGSRMSYTANYPDGSSEKLVSIPNYQFNWQMDYDLKEPKFIPAGTEIVVNGAFDNSSMNPFNPDPTKEITWGDQSWEEMFIGFIKVAYAE